MYGIAQRIFTVLMYGSTSTGLTWSELKLENEILKISLELSEPELLSST